MKEASDGELMTWIAQGNHGAFQEVYRRYAGLVFGYSLRLLKNRGTSEEVTQEVWIRVVRLASSYRADGSLKSWLYTVTRRTAFNYLRDHDHSDEIHDEKSVAASIDFSRGDFEEQILARHDVALIREGLIALPDSQRIALTLWMTEDLSYEQIATQMGVSESAVKSLLFRARATMEKRIRGGP